MALDLEFMESGLQGLDTHFIVRLEKDNYFVQHTEMLVWGIKMDTC